MTDRLERELMADLFDLTGKARANLTAAIALVDKTLSAMVPKPDSDPDGSPAMKSADELMDYALECDVRACQQMVWALDLDENFLNKADRNMLAQRAAAWFACADALRARAERAGKGEG